MDLNDPFEMRPAWTQSHQEIHEADQKLRNEFVANFPIFVATNEGLLPTGTTLGQIPISGPLDVSRLRGASDNHNETVFKQFHENFRVLSFVSNLDLTKDSKETDTLLWAHYGDQFQGVCLVIDPLKFNNGIRTGGYPVKYELERASLKPEDYEIWRNIISGNTSSPPTQGSLQSNIREQYINLLSRKSPAWRHEQEVRMIYDVREIQNTADYEELLDACPDCKRTNLSIDKCKMPNYRDAVILPAEAVVGVIFGADCSIVHVSKIMNALESPRYDHVKTYWSSLAPHLYQIQYTELPREHLLIYQREHTARISRSKDHYWWDKKSGLVSRPYSADKGANYKPPPKVPGSE